MRVVSRMPSGMRMQRYLEIEHAMLTQTGNEDHPCAKGQRRSRFDRCRFGIVRPGLP